MKLFFELDRG